MSSKRLTTIKDTVRCDSPLLITADQLIDSARGLKGVPFLHQGRTRSGVDCIGLIILSCKEAGMDLLGAMNIKFPNNYSRNADPTSVAILSSHCKQIYKPVPGCVLFFKFPREKWPRHFGIFTGTSVIHAEAWRKQVIEHGYRAHWLKWTHSMWLVPGVDYSMPHDGVRESE